MKEINEEEFRDRLTAIQRATKIFLKTGLTDNVSHAFAAYQEIFAEREREIFISTQLQGNRPRTKMDKYERPKCPDCEADMMFRKIPDNPMKIKTQLVCSKCDLVLSDEHDLDWWMQNLKVKNGSTRVYEGPKEV
jgi:hypothetical protein